MKIILVGNDNNSTLKLKKELSDSGISFDFIDYDKNKRFVIDLNIRFIPTILIYKNGELVKSLKLPITIDQIKNEISGI